MRFCLVDRVLSVVPGESIQTVKQVSLAEEYLQDHFPGFAVFPGVLMVECMVQSCAWLSRVTDDFAFSTVLLRQARAVRFNNFLKPGESLLVSATLKSSGVGESEFLVSGTVNGQSAVSGRLLLLKQNLAERNPQLADNDERLKAAMRDLWAQLWVPASAAAS
ncbi:MAG: beta-hydroxyacyl-ACP dehydratase [Planctomyces sp.]|jgi:3-hydroxyacyl-[acyl-carrier-protein] dehydratase|nr:beta-hydroxyacyl-ACP dehydratase [Planctomyces sp.]